MFEPESYSSLFAMEEGILEFWQKNKIFDKSLAKNSEDKTYSFFDGPPFITGTPHYATLLPSIAKDVIPRYQTMKGQRVRRVWGWDVHGLPAETQVEKRLGLKAKKDIEALGIDKFVAECRQYVGEVSESWRWYIDHIGRWVDMDGAYRTDQLDYMETVIWLFKQLHNKGLVYQGRRVSLYCPRCATPLSKFEITMDDDNYKMVEDPAVTVAFQLKHDKTLVLAWTTTPWTLPANLALAVDPKAEYVKVTDGRQNYILAHQALERYADFDLEIIETFKGIKLVGQSYEPLYTFFDANPKNDYQIYPADFVSMDDGTGVVHIAPGFGEDDTLLGEKVGLSLFLTIDDEGHFVDQVKPWAGQYYKKANPGINEDLKKRGLLFQESTVSHSYPHCYRCGTPLIYKSQLSWYLKIDSLREKLILSNKDIHWVPPHFGPGRFTHNLETAPDWSLSRTRYWGTPIPVWQTKDGEQIVVGSLKELEELSGQKIADLHRPNIDDVVLTTPSGKKAYRVKEVLDCWFESGAMPYAQFHYPFDGEVELEKNFPADFIVEYTGQLRGWFYYLHVLANALRQQIAFKNVVVTGVLMGTDGRKMSKSYGNYPDPRGTIEKYGAEALRLYFMGSRIIAGEDTDINEEEIRLQSRLLTVLHNSFRYFVTYANLHQYQFSVGRPQSTNVLDRWIRLRLEELIVGYSQALDRYELAEATKLIRPFIEDLSTWYIRRSRDRFVRGDQTALATLHEVLVKFSLTVAPLIPFTADYFYRALASDDIESVHLADYPVSDSVATAEGNDLLTQMDKIRQLSSVANMLRSEVGIPLRQPLARFCLRQPNDIAAEDELISILQEEINVEVIEFGNTSVGPDQWVKTPVGEVFLDTTLTPELETEGRYRELLRQIQEARKKAGLNVGELATLRYFTRNETLSSLLENRAAEICHAASFRAIEPVSDGADLTKLDKEEIAVAFDRA